jgi:hypothetical protein
MRQTQTAVGGGRGPSIARRPISRPIALGIIVLLVIVAGRLIFGHHENKYEHVAAGVTRALQKNDVAGVKQYQNVETATYVTASVVGRGADTLAPLGALKRVKQTAADDDTRIHQFDVTFDKGTLHETIKFDPDDKIVSFRYDEPVLTK